MIPNHTIPSLSGTFGIPTIRDRAIQALYKLALEPIAETLADPNSYGFRPKRSCADAIRQCHNVLSQRKSFSAALKPCGLLMLRDVTPAHKGLSPSGKLTFA